MSRGAQNRATAATGMNVGSSRSHSVFTVTVSQRDTISNVKKQSKLVLIDLAGSEMVKKTAATGQQLEEAKTINKSLSALGLVINALTDDKITHIPYRDSKLTRVLQDSLGGNSKTVLIVAASPSMFNALETVSTFRFGARAKNIENKAKVNATRSVEELEGCLQKAEATIEALNGKIATLETQLQLSVEQVKKFELLQLTARQNVESDVTADDEETNDASGDRTDTWTDKITPIKGFEMADTLNTVGDLSLNESDNGALPDEESTGRGSSTRSGPGSPSAPSGVSQHANQLLIEKLNEEAVVAAAALEASAANISALETQVESLKQQLEDEQSDGQRKETENESLTRLLNAKTKELAIQLEAVEDAQKQVQSQKIAMEKLTSEKESLVTVYEEGKVELEASLSRLAFEKLELESSIDTLRAENARMTAEIADMSGEENNAMKSTDMTETEEEAVADNRSRTGSGNSISDKQLQSTAGADSLNSSSVSVAHDTVADIEHGSSTDVSLTTNVKYFDTGICKEKLSMHKTEFNEILQHFSEKIHAYTMDASFTANSSDIEGKTSELCGVLTSWLDILCIEQLTWYDDIDKHNHNISKVLKKQSKLLLDGENQRAKIANDLQERVVMVLRLEAELSSVRERGMNSEEAKEFYESRDRSKMASLQQRLEQLVAVHRQLLRRYASLELENKEFRRKLQIRDDRIRSLESSNKELIISTRVQGERYLHELGGCKEIIEQLKVEQMKLFKQSQGHNQSQPMMNSRDGPAPMLRGGYSGNRGSSVNANSISSKTLRGGSGSSQSRATNYTSQPIVRSQPPSEDEYSRPNSSGLGNMESGNVGEEFSNYFPNSNSRRSSSRHSVTSGSLNYDDVRTSGPNAGDSRRMSSGSMSSSNGNISGHTSVASSSIIDGGSNGHYSNTAAPSSQRNSLSNWARNSLSYVVNGSLPSQSNSTANSTNPN